MEPIRIYFDFASPYAYFALPSLEKLAGEHGREFEWRPIILWAVMKAHGIAPPMDVRVKRDYFVTDMKRSAAFHGLPYRHPDRLPVSSHLPARVYWCLADTDPSAAKEFGRSVFRAFFTQGEDITSEAAITRLAIRSGLDEAGARDAVSGPVGRAKLAAAVDLAIADGVCGSPFVIIDGEPFFGADRVPQIAWRLGQSTIGR
ncbi:2-hydroxychromene-2-carboxylate isomerase [Mesorhizobium sp. L-8-3]|uniref:2-hydroxychromene-2-carboxylate isomerase n=1 Tax=Mesorhizobium sp. L-8-3 TaxID=2744522 RepID=UPI00192669FB|nr:2-hydroxychromene-2-carboxylate isomerase [Mesorhizobium sp. L-8-3]BCH25337.1 2-hydroxychromene-2-carboxylate isomerase [Mesorhizobium sp. L-8-3]